MDGTTGLDTGTTSSGASASATTIATTGATTGDTTSDTTSGTTFGDPDGSSSDTLGFIIPSDDGAICHGCCDLWAQDCPEGEKCTGWSNDLDDDWNGTRCSPIAPDPGQAGDPCTMERGPASGFDDCDLSSMCWNVDPETLEGTCVALCTGEQIDPMCASPDDSCFIGNDGVLHLCLPNCDPLLDDCQPDQACLPAEGSRFVCVSTGSGVDAGAGEACRWVYDCQPGLMCLPPADVGPPCDQDESGCCTPYCDLGAVDPAASCTDRGQVCTSWFGEQALPELEDVGACMLP